MIIFFLLVWSNEHECARWRCRNFPDHLFMNLQVQADNEHSILHWILFGSLHFPERSVLFLFSVLVFEWINAAHHWPTVVCRLSCITVFRCLGPYKKSHYKNTTGHKLPKNGIQSAQSKACASKWLLRDCNSNHICLYALRYRRTWGWVGLGWGYLLRLRRHYLVIGAYAVET